MVIFQNPPTENITQKIETHSLYALWEDKYAHNYLWSPISIEVLDIAITHGKEIRNIRTGKDETRSSLFVDDMFIYIENPRKPPDS